jgi:hypothetical protein
MPVVCVMLLDVPHGLERGAHEPQRRTGDPETVRYLAASQFFPTSR